jgi:hypothetical protein
MGLVSAVATLAAALCKRGLGEAPLLFTITFLRIVSFCNAAKLRHRGALQCSRLRPGSKSSACPSTRSALSRTESTCVTDQDLKDIGVLLGHRRKLQRARSCARNVCALGEFFVFSRHRSGRCIVLSQEVGINLSISNTHGLTNLKLMAAQFILL